MYRVVRNSLSVLMILIGIAGSAQQSSPAEAKKSTPVDITADTADVQHVIDSYHEAVVSHDGPRLARLFIPQGSVFLNVLSDEAYARAKARSPGAVKVRTGSYEDFVKQVTTSKASFNPTHTHLQENSDGTIASIYFDFVFFIDGKAENRGSETWTLVKGENGWRIAAITFSSNPPAS